MKIIDLRSIEVEPASEELFLYPDYLVNQLLKRGIGRLEADRKNGGKDIVDFIFTSHATGQSEVAASIERGFFRPLLARLGPRFGANDMLYMGHVCFGCEWESEGQKRVHRFSLFVCNEPTMDIWMKLYFYCIDGVWPTRKEAI